MKLKLTHLLSIGALVLIASSCYNDNKEEIYQNANNDCDTNNVTYSKVVRPLLTNNCTSGCHSGTTPAGGLDLTDYDETKSSAAIIVNRIKGQNGALMPQGGPALADCQINQIEMWVNDGAPNN